MRPGMGPNAQSIENSLLLTAVSLSDRNFHLREMLSLREMGVDVQIFSLLSPEPKSAMNQQVQAMTPYVHYSPFFFRSS